MTQLLFSFLSIVYIAGIFLWADSPVVEELSAFNPYSLLHIPLYGILTFLLIFSKLPFNVFNPSNPSSPINYIIPGTIAFVVAVADEIHQASIPGRNASITDVLLDVVGIVLVLIDIHQIRRRRLLTHSAAANRAFEG
jgi:VanZ family protein